ncbi:MAG: TRAP transporter small permease subunit, partial [Burkholderiaceae bacterium]
TFLSLGYTFRHGAHIRVTLLLQNLPIKYRRSADRLSLVVALLVVAVMTVSLGFITWEAWFYGDTTSDIIAIPIWIPQSLMTLGSAIFFAAIFDTLINPPERLET